MSIKPLFFGFSLLFIGTMSVDITNAGTLDKIKERGAVQCGVNRTGPGVSTLNTAGEWVGFFADFCCGDIAGGIRRRICRAQPAHALRRYMPRSGRPVQRKYHM